MEKSEKHRNGWALGLSVGCSIFIFTSFAFYRGFLNFGEIYVAPPKQVASVVSADLVPSPIQNTKKTFEAAFGEIGKKYQELTDSVATVFVPFISSIEVYQR
ncbi:MAG: hypothetical protein WC657_03295 [Candidatus Paceibacterota bacterium]